jgi:hypothetical protein
MPQVPLGARRSLRHEKGPGVAVAGALGTTAALARFANAHKSNAVVRHWFPRS